MLNVFDIEAFKNINSEFVPYCICFVDGGVEKSIYWVENENIIEIFLNRIFFENVKRKKIFYAHNLDFDGMFILEYLTIKKNNFKFKSFYRNLSIYSLSIYNSDKEIEFKCSYKLFPRALVDIANLFDLKINKQEFPHDFITKETLFFRGNIPLNLFRKDYSNLFVYFDTKKMAIDYCFNDVHLTIMFLKKIRDIVSKLNINIQSCYSIPSLSLKVFIKKFNKNRISFNLPFFQKNYIGLSYFGGRCEVYGNPFESIENIYHFDFSGMYSQCMEQKYPFGPAEYKDKINSIDKPGFYSIEAFSDNMYIPILPHHSKINRKLMFTNGEIKGVYWYEEINLFIQYGGLIKKINSAIIFEKYDYVFNEFIEYFENIKKIGFGEKAFGKLLINSLYGRCGMDDEKTITLWIKKKDFWEYSNLNIIKFKEFNEYFLVEFEFDQKTKKRFNDIKLNIKSNKAIASAITSKARIKLYLAQQEVLKNNGRLLYSDTDSIFASFDYNVDNCKMGEIYWDSSKKDTKIKDAVFISPKSYGIKYSHDSVVKIKGFEKNSINFEEIKNAFYDNESNIILTNNFHILKKYPKLIAHCADKTFNLQLYDKRVFDKYKKNTRALIHRNNTYV